MKNRWKFVVAFVLVGVLGSCIAGIWFVLPSTRLNRYQNEWEEIQPNHYYMEVKELQPGGSWHYAVQVQDGQVLDVVLMAGDDDKGAFKSWLDPETLTVEQLFMVADKYCAHRQRSLVDCQLKFDSQYFYPRLIDSYEFVIFKVEEFRVCSDLGVC